MIVGVASCFCLSSAAGGAGGFRKKSFLSANEKILGPPWLPKRLSFGFVSNKLDYFFSAGLSNKLISFFSAGLSNKLISFFSTGLSNKPRLISFFSAGLSNKLASFFSAGFKKLNVGVSLTASVLARPKVGGSGTLKIVGSVIGLLSICG